MELKKLLYTVLVLLFFTSCKTTSTIITSKNKAIRNGTYSPSLEQTNTTSVAKSDKKHKEPKRAVVGSVTNSKTASLINSETEEDIIDMEDNNTANYLVQQLINTAMEYLGVKYRFGGTTANGMDCSGLVFTTFTTFDVKVPRTSIALSKEGTLLKNSEIKKGDLVFFSTNPRKKQINHVGIVVDVQDNDIQFIHASTQSGVIISSTKEPYYKNTFVQANRILD